MSGRPENELGRLLRRECDLFFERVPCYVSIIDRDFRIIQTNEKFRETFGGAAGEVLLRGL